MITPRGRTDPSIADARTAHPDPAAQQNSAT
jgi:hypothetical protein